MHSIEAYDLVYSMVIKTWQTGKDLGTLIAFVYAGLWICSLTFTIIDDLVITEKQQCVMIVKKNTRTNKQVVQQNFLFFPINFFNSVNKNPSHKRLGPPSIFQNPAHKIKLYLQDFEVRSSGMYISAFN